MDFQVILSNLTNPTLLFFLLGIVAAIARSDIAVPAAMKLAAPKADPGLFIPMALGLTFPFNISLGMPIYDAIVTHS
jgi:uncharacterized protein